MEDTVGHAVDVSRLFHMDIPILRSRRLWTYEIIASDYRVYTIFFVGTLRL